MRSISSIFGFRGEIGRSVFAVTTGAAIIIYIGATQGAFALLPILAGILTPYGINAGLALNWIFLVIGVAAFWMLVAAFSKRLRDMNRGAWRIVLVIPAIILGGIWLLPLIGPELLLRLASLVETTTGAPAILGLILGIGIGLMSAWQVAECLLFSGTVAQRS